MTGKTNTSFHERFDIRVGVSEAQTKFINRVFNRIFDQFLEDEATGAWRTNERWRRDVADALGAPYHWSTKLREYIAHDFYKCLLALEALHNSFLNSYGSYAERLDVVINAIIVSSEIDLGMRWENGIFIRSGAKVLDEYLINESLRWLADPRFTNVRLPFEKGLSHFLASQKQPEVLADVITDMYEALEALAKAITGRTSKDLSANAELFIQKVSATEPYKKLLKDYIAYANDYRHAVSEGQRVSLSPPEVESFIYMTGLFIRLATTSNGGVKEPSP